MKIYRIDKGNMRDQFSRAWVDANHGIEGGDLELILQRKSKSREQEKKYHAMIGDIAKTVTLPGRQEFSPDVWKALLVDAFEQEKIQMGEPLRHPGSIQISLDGRRAVTVRPSTTKLSVREGSEFIEFLYKFGAEYGAKFSDPSMAYYEEAMQRLGR